MQMPSVYIVGAGKFGIHHLEGLLAARLPLTITIIDHSPEALMHARAVVAAASQTPHTALFVKEIPRTPRVDIAIIATTSHARAGAIRTLLKVSGHVRYLILEKILFDRQGDYASIDKLLTRKGSVAWVNCSRRLFPFHQSLKKKIGSTGFRFHLSAGERYGFMTSVIHYADYLCYLAGSTDFTVDTSLLVPHLLQSKRRGYFELCGTLVMRFTNNNVGILTTLPQSGPLVCTVSSPTCHTVITESSGVAVLAEKKNKWAWEDVPAPLPYQSALTGPLVERLLRTGRCGLTPYRESAALHLNTLEPIKLFLQKKLGKKYIGYPFT